MAVYIALFLIAIFSGVVQSLTGFGAVIIMMMVLPFFMTVVDSAAVAATIVMGLEIALVYRYRKFINVKNALLPAVSYLALSVSALMVVDSIDTKVLSVILGCFLLALSVYFIAVSKRIQIRPTWKTAVFTGAFSGLFSGLFGIGGPLMAVYFLGITDDKESYIGTMQTCFFITGIVNFTVRCVRGIFTVNMIPLVIVGIAAVNIGKFLGVKILNKINIETLRKFIYCFIGVSGIITIVKALI